MDAPMTSRIRPCDRCRDASRLTMDTTRLSCLANPEVFHDRWPTRRKSTLLWSGSVPTTVSEGSTVAAEATARNEEPCSLLFLPRLGSVVALQIRENGLCRGFGNRRAERADHLVHQPLPRGTREWGLHRDVRRAVTDTAEALHELPALSGRRRGRVRRPRPHGVDSARIISARCRLHLHPEVAGVIVALLDEAGGLRRLAQRRRARRERTRGRQEDDPQTSHPGH